MTTYPCTGDLRWLSSCCGRQRKVIKWKQVVDTFSRFGAVAPQSLPGPGKGPHRRGGGAPFPAPLHMCARFHFSLARDREWGDWVTETYIFHFLRKRQTSSQSDVVSHPHQQCVSPPSTASPTLVAGLFDYGHPNGHVWCLKVVSCFLYDELCWPSFHLPPIDPLWCNVFKSFAHLKIWVDFLIIEFWKFSTFSGYKYLICK